MSDDIQQTPNPIDSMPATDRDILRLIAERQRIMGQSVKDLRDDFAAFKNGLDDRLDNKYLTRSEFAPYRTGLNLVAGAVALAVIGALLYLVIRGGPAGHSTSNPTSTSALVGR